MSKRKLFLNCNPLLVASFCILFLSLLLFQTVPWLEKYFGQVPVESILFHINVGGTLSADSIFIISYSKRIFWSFFIAIFLISITVFFQKKLGKDRKISRYIFPCSLVLLCLSFVSFVYKLGIVEYVHRINTRTSFIEDNYVLNDTIDFPDKKKNIIVLVIESLDSSFITTKVFPQTLAPRLQKLQSENASFPLLRQTAGTTWTIASITGVLFGLPLKLPIDGNTYAGDYGTFLPGAKSLLEVLSENGYSSHWIVGSDAQFSGKDNLLSAHATHGHFYDKDDFISLTESRGVSLELAGWGVRDNDLYAYLPHFIDGIAQGEEPFFLLVETVDTHNPLHTYPDGEHLYNDKRDAFVTADKLAGDFVEWFKEQPFYEDTVLVIIGDHNYMGMEVAGFQLLPDRTLYNVFINSALPLNKPDMTRQATMLDFAPTVLEAIGAKVPERRFGLGASLVGPYPTLYEQFGGEELARQLIQRSDFYNTFFFEEAVQ